jgi:hypothetical protein
MLYRIPIVGKHQVFGDVLILIILVRPIMAISQRVKKLDEPLPDIDLVKRLPLSLPFLDKAFQPLSRAMLHVDARLAFTSIHIVIDHLGDMRVSLEFAQEYDFLVDHSILDEFGRRDFSM